MKPTLSERLLRWLRRNPQWIHGEELTKLGQGVGYEGETVRRRLREALAEGLVETEARKGKFTKSNWYRAK